MNLYGFVGNDPVNKTEVYGLFIDTVLDVISVGCDLYNLSQDPKDPWKWVSLGADAAGLLLPGVTGLGLGVKTLRKADNIVDAARDIEHGVEAVVDAAKYADEALDGLKAAPEVLNCGQWMSEEGRLVWRDGCFVAGTLVLMGDGSHKPIEKVQAGDEVLSKDESTGKIEKKKVENTSVRYSVGTRLLRFADGSQVETTDEHPLYVEGRGFAPAKEVGVGTSIVTRAGPSLKVTSNTALDTPKTVYNFTVADFHSYFVGDNNIWVHNNEICLFYKNGWTNDQRTEALEKVEELNRLAQDGRLKKTSVTRTTSASSMWDAAGGPTRGANDVDHIHELQLGGQDVVSNMKLRDASVNRSLGSQISHRIRNFADGTEVTQILIRNR